jgi:hypothetical protein
MLKLWKEGKERQVERKSTRLSGYIPIHDADVMAFSGNGRRLLILNLFCMTQIDKGLT